MENIKEPLIIDDTKIKHNGTGMCFKAKEIMLKELKEGRKVILIDPNEEWKELTNILASKKYDITTIK